MQLSLKQLSAKATMLSKGIGIPLMELYLYPQTLRHPQERRQPILIDTNFASIHKIQQTSHIAIGYILQYNYRMFIGMIDEQRLEVRAARRKYHFVCT